ncbi:MAG: response regulator [Calditrichaeota bacterium]|nr:response regulator [Calditrichota bacterium]
MNPDRYQELFERSADANLIIVGERFVDCNAATLVMLGYASKQEMLNVHPSMLSPEYQPDGQLSYEKANTMIQLALARGSNRFEWYHRRANGEIFPVEVLLTAIPDPGEQMLHVVWREIGARKHAEQALRDSRDQLAAIFEATHEGILVLDAESGEPLNMNHALRTMLNLGSGDSPAACRSLLPRELAVDTLRPSMADTPSGVAPLSVLMRRHDGRAFHAEVQSSPLTLQGRNCLIVVIRDVSERVQRESRSRHAQKLEAIGTLAGGIAHDFNNILASMLGYTELVLERLPVGSMEHEDLSEVVRSGQRAVELVRQILTFSRHTTSAVTRLDLHSSIRDVLQMLRSTLPSTVHIDQDLAVGSWVMADETQMQQVVMNLCTNAFHAMESTGGTLRIRLRDVELDDESLPHGLSCGSHLELLVHDTGSGIPPEVLPHVFDPYFTTKPQGKGSGLGLAMVEGIIKEHGGAITVSSCAGQGTRFRVLLPRAAGADTAPRPTSDAQPVLAGGPERILVVDDEPMVAELVRKTLEKMGYRVRTFTDSTRALAHFKDNPMAFDLVLTDQTMPNLTGYELARALLALRPELPIVLCTGFSSSIPEAKALELGIRAYLLKPTSRVELAHVVRRALDS